jgi:hypothetical protein
METIDFSGYKTSELADMVDRDVYGVREEAYKRSNKIRRQLERAKAQVAKLQSEHDQCGYALIAVSRQLDNDFRAL